MFEDIPVDSLDLRWFDRATRRRLEKLLRRADTVRDLWDLSPLQDRLAIERIVALHFEELGDDDDDDDDDPPHDHTFARPDATRPPAVGASDAVWRVWIDSFALGTWWEELLSTRHDLWSYPAVPGLRVKDVLTGAKPAPPSRYRDQLPLAQVLVESLVEVAVRHDKILVDQRRRELTRAVCPPEPLGRAWRAVSALRTRLYLGLVSVVHEPSVTAIDRDTLSVKVRWRSSEAVLDLDRATVLGADRPELVLLESLLDWLVTPTDARDDLARALALPAWRRALDRVVSAAEVAPLPEGEDKPLLGYEVEFQQQEPFLSVVQAREKKRGDGFVTRRVMPNAVPQILRADARDERVLTLIAARRHAEALVELVGHPLVFLGGEVVPVRRGSASLGVHRGDDGAVRVTFDVDGAPFDLEPSGTWRHGDGWLIDGSPRALRITVVPPALGRVLRRAGRGLPTVPGDAVEALLEVLPTLSALLPVHADPGVLGPSVGGDDRPLVALRWTQDSLGVALRVQPLPEAAPEPPGEGSELVCARRDGRVVHHRRDLGAERAHAARWAEDLGLGADVSVGPADWLLPEAQRALGIAERLRSAGDVRVAWEGDRLHVHDADASKLALRLSRGRDWFGVDGQLEVDGHSVALGVLKRAALAGHRYVALGKGHWAALDEVLRARLAAVDPDDRGVGVLHAPLFAALQEAGATIDAPPEWVDLHQRVRDARTLAVPVPGELRAELRDYQRDGVEWLARLSHWAPGAVLADDMGLGKTVQAIALLLRRVALGPALILAPTSVTGNWAAELARFAPSLRVVPYTGTRRAALLDGLKPGDVLLATYGVVANDAGAVRERSFATIVLDEAQAIRNPDSQRASVVHGLTGAFRVALTGTPVENRSLDLWSILQFAAPGLLGDKQRFVRTFAEPIDVAGDSGRRAALGALVAPFVLRRTKAEVAPELPPRTDIVVGVELGPDERATYERARLEAVERIASAGKRRAFQILEELTRLRRQVCHPRLVDPTSPLPSAKLDQAMRLLRDLREGGHRALVFSTMVSLLELVRDAAGKEGLTYCFLDGSTPPKRRQAEVARFQEGRTDVFFLSTKAGGVGLNLTAADYVVHLDPWWNPAAEDQASDRAHRIGQDKPVTVYRLIARGTVEEQIVALHAHKRELADALLTGAGSTELPDVEALAELLQGARGDADALASLEKKGRPKLRIVTNDDGPAR